MDRPPGILKEDGYPDVQAFKRTYDAATALVEQYNRNLDAWERQVNGERQPQQAPPEKESIRKKLRDMERRPNAGMPSVGRNLGTATMIRTLRQKKHRRRPLRCIPRTALQVFGLRGEMLIYQGFRQSSRPSEHQSDSMTVCRFRISTQRPDGLRYKTAGHLLFRS